MKVLEATVYMCLLACSLFANKYVLSVLGFQFPMVFQGWQTLVGCLTFKALSVLGKHQWIKITPMDWSGFTSLLPNFVLFTIYIIAGSKALASLPVIVYVTVGINILPALSHIIDVAGKISNDSQSNHSKSSRTYQMACTVTVIITSVTLLVITGPKTDLSSGHQEALDASHASENRVEDIDDLMYGAKFWLCVHVGCGLALSLHTRGFADQRFSFTDRLFYSYAFGLVVLLPASLYLEEAFEALHFRHRRQVRFVGGSLVAAFVGVSLNVYQARLKEDKSLEREPTLETGDCKDTKLNFGLVHHTSLAFSAILSTAFFDARLPSWAWVISMINLLAVIPIPSHIKPDENIPSNLQLPVKMTAATSYGVGISKPKKYAYTELPTQSPSKCDI